MNPNAKRGKAAEGLFLKMVDSDDPKSVLAREPDLAVRSEAERLWRHHIDAEDGGFLSASLQGYEPSEIEYQFQARAPLNGPLLIASF